MERQRILIVDDEPAVRRSLERALALEGYDIRTAEDGREALIAVGDDEPDAVVLDVLMPVVDSLEVCRHLRAESNPVPVLMLTARDTIGDRVAGLDAGADDYLVKPFALEELLARLRALLRRSDPGRASDTLRFADLTVDVATREKPRRTALCDHACECAVYRLTPTNLPTCRGRRLARPGRT